MESIIYIMNTENKQTKIWEYEKKLELVGFENVLKNKKRKIEQGEFIQKIKNRYRQK